MHASTLRKFLKKLRLRGCVAIRKPILKRSNKPGRLIYAKDCQNWIDVEWIQEVWTDKFKFQLLGLNMRYMYKFSWNHIYKQLSNMWVLISMFGGCI